MQRGFFSRLRLARAGLICGMTGFALLALALPFAASGHAADAGTVPHIIVGVDISEGSPYVSSKDFAEKAADKIAEEIRDLPMRAKVTVRTVGSYQSTDHTISFDSQISRFAPGKKVSGQVSQLVGVIPQLVQQGKLSAHRQSNIVAFLTNISRTVDCSQNAVTVILASDGFEQSEYTDLKNADAELPAPEGRPFDGCVELQILGLGQGQRSPRTTERLYEQWERWAQRAGFSSFIGLNDW